MRKNYSKRELKEFNKIRKICQAFICRGLYYNFTRLFYNLKVEGLDNIPKDKSFILASNHLSNYDPFLLAGVLRDTFAFMAKQELFETAFSRLVMDVCGAFSVNREKVEVSTMKTALSIHKTQDWKLALFPQGTRDCSGVIKKLTTGFATLARATKTDILPVGIVGADKKMKLFNKNDIIIKVGEIIPYNENIDEMVRQWGEAVSKLTGFEYQPA